MSRPWNPSERRRFKLRVSELYRDGFNQGEIAEIMHIAQSSVSRLITELTQDWLEEGVFNFNEARKAELAKINTLELEAWEAWRRSRGTKKKETKTTGISAQGNHVDETSETKWKEVGDPRYLAQVQWCINKRCELLGLDSPSKHEISGKNGGPIPLTFYDWFKLETGKKDAR